MIRVTLLVILCSIATAGCFGSAPDTHYYTLLPPSKASRSPRAETNLMVEQVEVDSAYEDERIAYRTSPYQLQYYNYHFWGAPPSMHISDTLRTAYDATGLFQQVTRAPTSGTDAILTGRVTAFEEVDRTDNEWFGRIEVELRLHEARTGELLWSQQLREEQPLEQRTPEGLASALSVAMARIVQKTAPAIDAAARSASATAALESRTDGARLSGGSRSRKR